MGDMVFNNRQHAYNADREHYQSLKWWDEEQKRWKTQWEIDETRAKSKARCQAFPVAEDFVCRNVLGRGAYGTVYLAQPKAEWLGEGLVALKSISCCNNEDEVFSEAEFLRQVNHDNVIRLFGYFYDASPFLILEAADGTLEDLNHLNHANGNSWNEYNLFQILSGMLKGVRMIHEHGILHLDIKPCNVLIVGGKPKLSDFGAAVKIQETHNNKNELCRVGLTRFHTTFEYANYEGCVMETDEVTGVKLTYASAKSDLYSVGATIFECLQGYKLMQYGNWAYLNPTVHIEERYALAHKEGRLIEGFRRAGNVGLSRWVRYDCGLKEGVFRNSMLNRVKCAPPPWYQVIRSLLALDREPLVPELGVWPGWQINSAGSVLQSMDFRILRAAIMEYRMDPYTAELPTVWSKVNLKDSIKTSRIKDPAGNILPEHARRRLGYGFYYINNKCSDLAKKNKLLPRKEGVIVTPRNDVRAAVAAVGPSFLQPHPRVPVNKPVGTEERPVTASSSTNRRHWLNEGWIPKLARWIHPSQIGEIRKCLAEWDEEIALGEKEVGVADPAEISQPKPVAVVAPLKMKSNSDVQEPVGEEQREVVQELVGEEEKEVVQESVGEEEEVVQVYPDANPKRTYRSQEGYRRILKVGNRFGCPICPKTFANKGNVSRHKPVHFKEGVPNHCPCGKKFLLLRYLREHQCELKKKGEEGSLWQSMKEEYDDIQREAAEKAKAKEMAEKTANPKKRGRPPNPKPLKVSKLANTKGEGVSGNTKMVNPPDGSRAQEKVVVAKAAAAAAAAKGKKKTKKIISRNQQACNKNDYEDEELTGYASDASVASNPF